MSYMGVIIMAISMVLYVVLYDFKGPGHLFCSFSQF